MGSRDRLESSDSMSEWALIDSDESGHQTEEECNGKEGSLKGDEKSVNTETGRKLDEFKSKATKPKSKEENVKTKEDDGIEEIPKKVEETVKKWTDPSKSGVSNAQIGFYKSNLDNLTKLWLLLFISTCFFYAFIDRSGNDSGLLDLAKGGPNFADMNSKQMELFLNKDNEQFKILTEELKKIKAEPFLITGKEGKTSQSLRSLLNDLIVTSEKLVSTLAELNMEDFPDEEKPIIKSLLQQNLKLRTDYHRRKYLEGDFETLKLYLDLWNDKYANLRSEVVRKYTDMKHDVTMDKQIAHNEVQDAKIPKVDDKLVTKVEDAIRKIKSAQLAASTKIDVPSKPQQKQTTEYSAGPKDESVAPVRQIKTEPKEDAKLAIDSAANIDDNKEILQMLKDLSNKYYKNVSDKKRKSKAKMYSKNEKYKESNELQQWEEKLLRNITKIYAKYVEKSSHFKNPLNMESEIDLVISDQVGKQLMKKYEKSLTEERHEKSDVSSETPKRKRKPKKKLLSDEDIHYEERSSIDSPKSQKHYPSEGFIKDVRKIQEYNKDDPHSFKQLNSKEKKNIFRKKFSAKKEPIIPDDSILYKGQYNKVNKKTSIDSCEDNGDNEDNDTEDDEYNDTNNNIQPQVPYLRRRMNDKNEYIGMKKHWDRESPHKHFREPSANPKKQFIPRTEG